MIIDPETPILIHKFPPLFLFLSFSSCRQLLFTQNFGNILSPSFYRPPYLHLHSFLFVSTRGKKLHPLFHFPFHRLEIHQQTRQEEVSVNLETVAIICNTLLAITTKISHKYTFGFRDKYIFEFSDKYVFELKQPRYRTNIYLKTKIGT